jgi:hypothetical protein
MTGSLRRVDGVRVAPFAAACAGAEEKQAGSQLPS